MLDVICQAQKEKVVCHLDVEGAGKGSVGKGACCRAGGPESDPRPHMVERKKKEATFKGWFLSST